MLFFDWKILLIETAAGEFRASASAIGAHRLKRADKLGALLFNDSLDLVHYLSGCGVCLHAKTAASHEHKLLRVYVHHMRNGGILRRFGAVVVFLTVVSLALNKVRNAYKVTAEVNRNIVGNHHFDAEVESSYRAVLTEQKLFSPFLCGKLGACFADGVEGTELTKHPIFFGGVF